MKKIKRLCVASALAMSLTFGAMAPTISVAAATSANASNVAVLQSEAVLNNTVNELNALAYNAKLGVSPLADDSTGSLSDTIDALIATIESLGNMVKNITEAVNIIQSSIEPTSELFRVIGSTVSAVSVTAVKISGTVSRAINQFPNIDLVDISKEVSGAIQELVDILNTNITDITSLVQEIRDLIPAFVEAIKTIFEFGNSTPAPNPDPENVAPATQRLLAAQKMVEKEVASFNALAMKIGGETVEVEFPAIEEKVEAPVITETVTVSDPTAFTMMAIAAAVTVVLGGMFVVSAKKFND